MVVNEILAVLLVTPASTKNTKLLEQTKRSNMEGLAQRIGLIQLLFDNMDDRMLLIIKWV